jgi:molecular chaperone GrpE
MKKKTDVPLEVNTEAEEWKNKYLRALADYQNLEKRVAGEKVEIRKYAAEVVIARLLPTLDTLAKAKAHIKDSGLYLAYKELETALTEFGVIKIEVVGKQFNPHEMECIEVVNGTDNEVIEETLPGYRLHDKILRVAQVKVGKKLQN